MARLEDTRLGLDARLRDILGVGDSMHLYYQPPSGYQMKYPCVVYKLEVPDTRHANNKRYLEFLRWQLIAIDRNPDSGIPDTILDSFPMCRFDRHYVADNLHHFVFTLFFGKR